MNHIYFFIGGFLLIFRILLPETAVAEGTKEIYIGNHDTWFFLCNDFAGHCNQSGQGNRTQFAIYGCDETSRLYFVTTNTNELIYVGFNVPSNQLPNGCHAVFRIKDLAGNIVYAQTTVPSSGVGFISSYTQAQVGPQQIYGSNGYNAIDWHPPYPGTFYIEFQELNNTSGNAQTDNDGFYVSLFDLTVYDSVIHSQSWEGFIPRPGSSKKVAEQIMVNITEPIMFIQ